MKPRVTALSAAVAPLRDRVLRAPPSARFSAEVEATLKFAGVHAASVVPTLPLRALLRVTTLATVSTAEMVVPAAMPAPETYWPTARPAVSATVTVVPATLPVVAVRIAVAVTDGTTEPAAAT